MLIWQTLTDSDLVGDDLHSTILEEIHYATVYGGFDDLGRQIVMRLLFQLYLDELSNSWAIEWAS